MPIVHIPSQMQDLTGGSAEVVVQGQTIRQVIDQLEEEFSGIKNRVCEEGAIRVNIAVWVNGEIARGGMIEQVDESSQIHFLPALSGG